MRGRKPSNPTVSALANGTFQPDDGAAEVLYPPPPDWITDPNARAMWVRLVPELIVRKKYISLFEAELARYCIEHGVYVDACEQLQSKGEKRSGRLNAVRVTKNNAPVLHMWRVVMRQASETMQRLAGDLGFNPVAMQRMEALQLEQKPKKAGKPAPEATVSQFGSLRRHG